MATLHKLRDLNDEQIQNWLRKVGQENAARLVIAMLGADEDVRKLIYKNMSPLAARVLKENLEKYKKTSYDENTILNHANELEKLI